MAHPVFWPTKTFFYPIGNTSPVSLFQHVPPGADADILLLGCGDPRNVLYSVYAHGIDTPSDKSKLDFTLCDFEPAIHARNVLLFTLISSEDMIKSPSKLWNIFYHFFLDNDSLELLQKQAQMLVDLSSSLEKWTASEYSRFLEVGNGHTLAELHRVWQLYAQTARFSPSREKGLKDKYTTAMKKIHSTKLNGSDITASRSAGPLSIYTMMTSTEASRAFWKTGVTFTKQHDISAAIHVNPLFAYATDGEGFFTHYGTLPLAAFHLAPMFMDKTGMDAAPLEEVYDGARAQFRSWCDAFHACIKPDAVKVKVRVIVGDVLAVCQALHAKSANHDLSILPRVSQWQGSLLDLDGDGYSAGTAPLRFDVIETSNLCDHLGTVNILVSTVPLMKPIPWAALFTETLLSSGENPMTSITESLFGELTTMSLLFDITPTSYIAGYKTESNVHEVVDYHIREKGAQYHERLTWKAPSRLSTTGQISLLAFEPAPLAALLFQIYDRMFFSEDLSRLVQRNLKDPKTLIRNSDLIHYCRKSFVALLAFLRTRITVKWDEVMSGLLSRVPRGSPLMTGMLYYQDFLTQLHLFGLHSEPNFIEGDPLLVKNRSIGRFRNWSSIPPVVCVAFTVPRSKLQAIEGEGAPPSPIFHVVFDTATAANHFSSMEMFFGSLSFEGEGEDAVGIISEDPAGKSSGASIVVSACVPAWMLVHDPLAMSVRLALASTPSTATLSPKLGLMLTLWESKLSDLQKIHILRERPTVSSGVHAAVPYIRPAQQLPSSPTTTVTLDGQNVASLAQRVVINDPKAQATLKLKVTPVTVRQVSGNEVKLSIGSTYHETLSYPFTCDVSEHKLRVARQSSWIEVVVPPALLSRSEASITHRFPTTAYNNGLLPWVIHRINLDRLPLIATPKVDKPEWVNTHVSLAFSDREHTARQNKTMDPITHVKDSMHSIFVQAIGLQGPMKVSVFGLHRTSGGGIDTLVFITGLRLDLSGHAVVADAFVLPLHDTLLDRMAGGLQALLGQLCQVNITDDECTAWKVLLPSLVERCRTWEHTPKCAYIVRGKVPLSVEHGEVPICDCGKGKVTDAFRHRKEWSPFLPHVTRVAVSPLFAVSYLESIAGRLNLKGSLDAATSRLPDSGSGSNASTEESVRCNSCNTSPPAGKKMVCSKCKKAVYCSRECQTNDWKKHKPSCKKA